MHTCTRSCLCDLKLLGSCIHATLIVVTGPLGKIFEGQKIEKYWPQDIHSLVGINSLQCLWPSTLACFINQRCKQLPTQDVAPSWRAGQLSLYTWSEYSEWPLEAKYHWKWQPSNSTGSIKLSHKKHVGIASIKDYRVPASDCPSVAALWKPDTAVRKKGGAAG